MINVTEKLDNFIDIVATDLVNKTEPKPYSEGYFRAPFWNMVGANIRMFMKGGPGIPYSKIRQYYMYMEENYGIDDDRLKELIFSRYQKKLIPLYDKSINEDIKHRNKLQNAVFQYLDERFEVYYPVYFLQQTNTKWATKSKDDSLSVYPWQISEEIQYVFGISEYEARVLLVNWINQFMKDEDRMDPGPSMEDVIGEDLEYYGVDDASPESDEYKMGIKEDIPIYKQDTPHKTMYEYLRMEFPETPEYILKDFYYNHIVDDDKVIKQIMTQFWGDPVMYIGDYWKRYLRGPWKLKIIEVNPMDFTDRTVRAFLQREFGEVDAYQVKNDKERMEIQKKLATKTGSNEPIIVEITNDGKYDLIEGWHRTMAALLLGDNGEDMKNWNKVKLRAFVKKMR
jgi:hypothetical protein